MPHWATLNSLRLVFFVFAGPELVRYTFSDVLQQSISVEQITQAWCNTCNKYQPHVSLLQSRLYLHPNVASSDVV